MRRGDADAAAVRGVLEQLALASGDGEVGVATRPKYGRERSGSYYF